MRKNLEQMRALLQEVQTLRSEYINMPKAEDVGDTYGDYRSGHKVTKVFYGASTMKSDKLLKKIQRKVMELEEAINKCEDFIESVDDPEIRNILRLYYVVGLSQDTIGIRMGYSRQAIGDKLTRFWKTQEKSGTNGESEVL